MSFTAEDARYMARAVQLAARGQLTTRPNPRVGCVLVRDGSIVGEGYHQRAGEPHAEVFALRHLENMPIQEIADRMARSNDAIRSSLYRVKRLVIETIESETTAERMGAV